MKNSLTHMPPF